MNLTDEQHKILASEGNIKVNAVAGSGKTTTVIAYAKSRPVGSNILYLAFNRTVRIEAKQKLTQHGVKNVSVETAHSLAYKHIVLKGNYTLQHGYQPHEIVEILKLRSTSELTEFVIANHILKFMSFFCNSVAEQVSDLDYLDVISDSTARSFAETNYETIELGTRRMLALMDQAEINITHDFYLKKFQLSRPLLKFDYILFDEGQDASAAMLDVFMRQTGTKVIVGDTHQQIYGWRYAVNSLEMVDFEKYMLSRSFRFGAEIASLAKKVLGWKKSLDRDAEIDLIGGGTATSVKSKATIARTNLGLLLKAIEFVSESEGRKKLYFEGNIHSYTYADEGTSLYDVLNLFNRKHRLIRDKLIKKMADIDALEEYIKKTEEMQLGMMVEIVKEYRNKIPRIIQQIKDQHVSDDQKDQADMIFSTVHRCKGMEYDSVQLVEDFISEERLKKIVSESPLNDLERDRLNEEINLLYVAVTRARNQLLIPEALIPDGYEANAHVHLIKSKSKDEPQFDAVRSKDSKSKGKSFDLDEARKKHKRAYAKWSKELDDELTVMFCNGVNMKDMAKHFGRSKGAIRSRIKRLELEELYS